MLACVCLRLLTYCTLFAPRVQLLDRVFRIMMSKNPNMEQGGTSRLVIRPPQVERLGTRRSAFVNFSTICKQYVSLVHLTLRYSVACHDCALGALGYTQGPLVMSLLSYGGNGLGMVIAIRVLML